MSKLENIRFAEFKGFDLDEQYSKYRQIIGIDKSDKCKQLTTKDYTNWKEKISTFYNALDTDSKERFVWAIKSSLNFLSNARDSLFSIIIPVVLVLFPVIVTYITSIFNDEATLQIHPFIYVSVFIIYSVFFMCIFLVLARNSSIEKQFYESILDIIEK